MPNIGDVIELVVDVPNENLRAGIQGTIVHQHTDKTFEVEFVNDEGETRALLALDTSQFIVVWQAATKQWVPLAERAAYLVSILSDDAAREVVDFARFLKTRQTEKLSVEPN